VFQLQTQYLDSATGFHVITLKDAQGNQHIVQIAVGADKCPACGAVYPKDNVGEINPAAMIATVNDSLNKSYESQLAYAKKHGLKVRPRAS
jgi:hypothetical protein